MKRIIVLFVIVICQQFVLANNSLLSVNEINYLNEPESETVVFGKEAPIDNLEKLKKSNKHLQYRLEESANDKKLTAAIIVVLVLCLLTTIFFLVFYWKQKKNLLHFSKSFITE